jgi:hypothetical protein
MAVAAFAAFSVVISTESAIDIADRTLSAIANVLGLHEASHLSTLAILVIPALYLAFRQRRRS